MHCKDYISIETSKFWKFIFMRDSFEDHHHQYRNRSRPKGSISTQKLNIIYMTIDKNLINYNTVVSDASYVSVI